MSNEREQAYADLVRTAKFALVVLRAIPRPAFPQPGYLDGILAEETIDALEKALNNPDLAQMTLQ